MSWLRGLEIWPSFGRLIRLALDGGGGDAECSGRELGSVRGRSGSERVGVVDEGGGGLVEVGD